jgi:cytochrome P450
VLAIDGMGVLLNRRDLIDDAFRNPRCSRRTCRPSICATSGPLIPLQIDPPQHKSYRKILDPLFAPREMVKLEDAFAARVNTLIDGFIERGTVDFAQEFSIPFPSLAFLALLGLPADELPSFLRMKDGIIRPDFVIGKPREDPTTKAYQREIATSIYEYFDRVIDARIAQREDDLISRFLDTEVDGERLTREEILDICFLFLIAGLDTVTATLDCMFGFFVEHPEHRREIVDDPSLIPAAVEELLRWETPVMTVVRVAMEDTEIGGCPVREGDHVMAMLSSANLDDAEFPDGDASDSTAKPTVTSRSASASTGASAPTSRAPSSASHSANGTGAFPTTRSSRAPASSSRPPSAPWSTSPWCSPPGAREG